MGIKEKKRQFSGKASLYALLALILAASFLFDNTVAAAIKNSQNSLIAGYMQQFNLFFAPIYAILFLITIAATLKDGKQSGKRTAITMLLSVVASVGIVYFIKFIIQRARPDGGMLNLPFGVPDYSFPSSHAAITAAAAQSAPATTGLQRLLKYAWLVFTATTIFSRVYLNFHFLSDTIAGLLLATVISDFIKQRMKEKLTFDDGVELTRQAMHLLFGLLLALFAAKHELAWLAMLATAAAGLAVSYIIKNAASTKNAILRAARRIAAGAMRLVERKEELQKFPGKGAIMLFLGAGVTAALFRNEAAAAIIILAAGDSFSHVFGRLAGRRRHKLPFAAEKTAEGSVAGFVFASAAAAMILPVWIAIAGAAAGMIAEALNVRVLGRKIDDNVTVPLAAAAVIWSVTHISYGV